MWRRYSVFNVETKFRVRTLESGTAIYDQVRPYTIRYPPYARHTRHTRHTRHIRITVIPVIPVIPVISVISGIPGIYPSYPVYPVYTFTISVILGLTFVTIMTPIQECNDSNIATYRLCIDSSSMGSSIVHP